MVDGVPNASPPTGTVTFKDGSATLGTATLSGGVAALSISAFGAGAEQITATYGGEGSTYTASTSSAVSVDVTPAPLTITANNQTKAYGAAMPALTASYSGLVNGDTPANLSAQPTLTTTATAGSHVSGSPYTITASGAADPNYTISYIVGALTVTPAPLTITANNQSMVYGPGCRP